MGHTFHSVQKNDSIQMTKRSYMEAVIKGLRAVTAVDVDFGSHDTESDGPINDICNGSPRKKIYVRLLLSIDRRESTVSAMETVC